MRPSAATMSTRSSSPPRTINWRPSRPKRRRPGRPSSSKSREPAARANSTPWRMPPCRTGALVRIGFNHRYHRAFRKAREIFESGALGDMMFIRGRYGHGGRPGYDQEWRADPAISGGGELIDQGAHLIDLSRWFLGDFTRVRGSARTWFWDMPVE